MAMMMQMMAPVQSPGMQLMHGKPMNCQTQLGFARNDTGFVAAPAPGIWGNNLQMPQQPPVQRGEQQPIGNTMMMPCMYAVRLPEQAVPSKSDISDAASCKGNPGMAFISSETLPTMAAFSMDSLPAVTTMSMDSLPPMTPMHTMAAVSMESLPPMSPMAAKTMGPMASTMPGTMSGIMSGTMPGATMAVMSMDALPSMAVMSMDSLPEMTVEKQGSRAYAVNSVDSLPTFVMPKTGTRRRKRGGRKSNNQLSDDSPTAEQVNGETTEQLPSSPATHNHQIGKHAQRNGEKSKSSFQQPQEAVAEDPEPAVEPDVDPVILELEGSNSSTQRHTLDWVISSVWTLALTRRGSRILQKALDVGTPSDQLQILNRLEGHVQEAMRSPHANYVLQKCIEVMAPERVQFILDELKGDAVMAARHRFGCRILQRLIEHCPLEQTEELAVEVLSDVSSLCRHQFGNFVVQHIMQHGSPEHKHCIADVLQGDIIRLAKHRIASHVVSCAMVHCASEDVQRLTQVVLADAGQLADLSRREYGSFVVREVNRARRLHGAPQADA